MKDAASCIVPSCGRGRRGGGELCLECGEIRDAIIAARAEIEPDRVVVIIDRFLQHPQCPALWDQAVDDQARRQLIVNKFLVYLLRESGRSKIVKVDDEQTLRWGKDDGGDDGLYMLRKSGRWIKQQTGILLTLAQMTKLNAVWRKLKGMRS